MRYFSLVLGAVGILTGIAHAARADVVGGCNFSFSDSPDDRGSVQMMQRSGRISMQLVQDDDVSILDPVKSSTATGDQVRAQIIKDAALKSDLGDAKVYLQDVSTSNAYTVDGPSGSNRPAAQFFTFYGSDQRFLGGFGSVGDARFICDWVSTDY